MIPVEIVVTCAFLWLGYLLFKGNAKRDALREENAALHQKNEDLNTQLGKLATAVIEQEQSQASPRPPTTTRTRRPHVGEDIK